MASSFSVLTCGTVYANIACCIYFLMLVFPISESVYFQATRFDSNEKDIIYIGDAVPSSGAVEFTNPVPCCLVGQIRYKEKVPLWDSNSGKVSDFVTHFTFVIDTEGFQPYGNGLAFFLAPVDFTVPLNSAAAYLGLFNSSTRSGSSQPGIVLVEFDSYINSEWDPPMEHVGININSLSSVIHVPWNASLHSKDTANAWVSYNATTKNLSVFLTYERNPKFQGNSNLSYEINLRDVLPSWVTIGISASTGLYRERNTLQSWEFNSSLVIKEESKATSQKVKLAVGLAVPLGVLLAGGIIAYIICLRSRKIPSEETLETIHLSSINDDLERGAGPKRFSYRDLALATNNFADDLKLGKGGFGFVYKGYLDRERKVVAVKKISSGSTQGKKEYITEVKVISSLRHRNLVQLTGWCHNENQFLLVYEFMPNGSLDTHLFGKMAPLAWGVRYKISLGLASALLYLHEEGERCVIHRDIKPGNVLLDSGFNVKLGDFGLARLMDHELGLQTTRLAGTRGYMAPEYVRTGKASKESDVYSFGVVAIEICCGRKATDCIDGVSEMVDWVRYLHRKGEILSGVDERLNRNFDAEQAKCLMMVGLWCTHPDPSHRPSIRKAIQHLNFEVPIPNVPLNTSGSSGNLHITSSSINAGR